MRKSLIWAIPAIAALATPAAAMDWNGFYAGASLGYSAGTSNSAYDNPSFPFGGVTFDMEPSGFAFGGQAGANFDLGTGVVFGLEGDAYYGSITDTVDDVLGNTYHGGTGPHFITSDTDFSGTLRGRVGFNGGDFLPYLTAGIAFANTTASATDGPLSETALLTGWAAGAGFEFAAQESMSFKLEYLYTDLGEHTWYAGEDYQSTSSSTSGSIRAGVNFHFD